MPSSILASFLGALQASLSVLLTISYGVLGTQLDLLNGPTAKKMSKLSVKMFLPALLFVNVGSQLDINSWPRYVPVLIWAIVYNFISMAMGLLLTWLLKLPTWATPAITFQNASALPLLLVQSLETTGILDNLLSPGDTSADAVLRAQSYFLVNSMIANSFTFGIGPRLLGVQKSQPSTPTTEPASPPESPSEAADPEQLNRPALDAEAAAIAASETTSLLPKPVARTHIRASHRLHRLFPALPRPLRRTLSFTAELLSGPLIAGLLGAFVGLIPPLRTAFFAPGDEGGVLTPWLTASIRNVGQLFPPLQVVLVGVKLAGALLALKNGGDRCVAPLSSCPPEPLRRFPSVSHWWLTVMLCGSGRVPWRAFVTITAVRFVVWPAISIPLVYALAAASRLPADPVLWFALMLMPVGPSALKLTALAEVAGVEEREAMGVAKFLTVTYAISPLICVACVGAVKACEGVGRVA